MNAKISLPTHVPLSDTDRIILKYLLKDPRASIADIARETGIQRDTVHYRIDRFEKRGLITKFHVIIDPMALGCEIFMLVLIKLAPLEKDIRNAFLKKLVKHKNVTHVSRLVGKYDYYIQMAATDIIAFDTALDEIKSFHTGIITEIEMANVIDGLKTDDFSGLISTSS